MAVTGIYCIEHVESGKKYIGSAVRFNARWALHRKQLRAGRHHSVYLQRAWDKHGEGAFEFRKLLFCSKENLLMYEQRCMDGYNVCDREHGYNTVPTAGSQLGYKHSAEARAKMSASRRKYKQSPETREKAAASLRGRKHPGMHSLETRAFLRKYAAKLTEEQVREVQTAVRARGWQTKLAEKYGVHASTISNIVTGKRWGPLK